VIPEHRISFSGGQTSGYLLRKLMDANPQTFDRDFAVDFANTGREFNQTLDFVRDVEMKWGVRINWLEYCRDKGEHSFRMVDYKTAARRNTHGPFDEMLEWCTPLPNVAGRGCSGQLKVRTIRRFLQAIGLEEWHSYVGIRSDEAHRTLEVLAACPSYITPRFPLNEDGTTLAKVNKWWDAQPFKLNIGNHQGNCDLCFLKKRWKRVAIMREDPSCADWWIGWERKKVAAGVTHDGAQWITGKSYEGELADALHPEFDFMDNADTEEEPACSCVVGGFREEARLT
jgi:hypothetical protein